MKDRDGLVNQAVKKGIILARGQRHGHRVTGDFRQGPAGARLALRDRCLEDKGGPRFRAQARLRARAREHDPLTVAGELGMDIKWQGSGLDEVGIDRNTGREVIAVDPRYFRPTEVDTLLGDPSKAKKLLGWESRISFAELVKEMVAADDELVRRRAAVADAGYTTYDRFD